MLCSGHTHLLVVLSIYLSICVLGFIHLAQMKLYPLPSFSPIFPSTQPRATTSVRSASMTVTILDPTYKWGHKVDHSVVKKKIHSFPTTWMNPEDVRLRETGQTKEDKATLPLYPYG